MSYRLGPFQFVYSEREQKIRDTIQHLIQKYGFAGARFRVIQEYLNSSGLLGPDSEQAIWWNDVRWYILNITSHLDWGRERGL